MRYVYGRSESVNGKTLFNIRIVGFVLIKMKTNKNLNYCSEFENRSAMYVTLTIVTKIKT